MLCQNMGFSNDAVQFISYVTKALLNQSMDFHDGVGEEEQMFSMGHSCIRGQHQGKTILLDFEELCPTKNALVSGIRYKLACAYSEQRHSQNAEKVMHIKGRLLYITLILYNYVPFQIGTSLKGENLLPEGTNSFL